MGPRAIGLSSSFLRRSNFKNRRVSPRVRAFVDWLAQLFKQAKHVDRDLSRVHQLSRGMHPA